MSRSDRRVRVLSLIEGVTLLTLVAVAVPLKRIFGLPEVVSVVGPIHGVAFIAYIVVLIEYAAAGDEAIRRCFLLALLAFVPFGFLLVPRLLSQPNTAS
ncbi:MAG: DUF3817 domain-containing protein [Myxococcota bacterium]